MAEGIELEVYHYSNWELYKATLQGRTEPSFLEELKAEGGGSFKISSHDSKIAADPTLIKSRNIIKTRVNGNVVGAMLVNGRDSDTISEGEVSKEIYTISGSGLKTWFDDAEVRPYGGLRSSSMDKRAFSFASLGGDWYDPTDWANPTPVFRVGDTSGSPWRFSPENWPSDAVNAKWVWSSDSATGAPAGDNFFRMAFNINGSFGVRKYAFWVAADDQYSVYIDGEKITESDINVSSYGEAKKIELDLRPGDHILGIRVRNYSGKAGLAAAMFRYTVPILPIDKGVVTINSGDNRLEKSNIDVVNGDKVYIKTTGTLPVGLEADKEYWVIEAQAGSIRLAKSKSGPRIQMSGPQSGTFRLIKVGVDEKAELIWMTGMNAAESLSRLNKADAKVEALQEAYMALPPGNPDGGAVSKAQAKKKAAALAKYRAAVPAATFAQMEYDAVIWQQDAGYTWKVLGYPEIDPGWTPGEILLTLLAEAEERQVQFPSLLTPTFTTTTDTYGNSWGDPLDWEFDISESYFSVIGKLEELVCDIWINPDTFELNMAIERGVDRSVFKYDVDGITVLSAPIIFEKGKNITKASMKATGKIKNALSLKTNNGWASTSDAASVAEYGRIEGTLDTGASLPVSQSLAKIIFLQKATEEEGASYEIYITDKIPFVHFDIGDWVLAPNEQGLLVKRRILSISIAEVSTNGKPVYAIEFDTIFRDNEDRVNRVLTKLGGGGVGGSSSNNGGSSGGFGTPTIVTPPSTPKIKIPETPDGLFAFSVGAWTADGVNTIAEVTLTWNPVTQNTDGTELIPLYYQVWAHKTEEDDTTYQQYALVTESSATMRPFEPGSDWTFKVIAQGSQANSADSEEITHVMDAPNVPMLAPDQPTLESNKGVLIVKSDGLLSGQVPPPQYRYTYVIISDSEMGTYQRMGTAFTRDTRQVNIAGLIVGNTYWVRLVAVDGVGLITEASPAASHTLTGIDLGDLDASIGEAIEAANAAAIAAHGTNNLLIDPSFEGDTEDDWSLESADSIKTTSTPRTGLQALSLGANTAEYVGSRYQHWLPADQGDMFYISAWARTYGAGASVDNAVGLCIEYGDTQAVDGIAQVAGTEEGLGSTYTLFNGVWEVPAGVKWIRPCVSIVNDITDTNIYLIDDITLRRQIPGYLIVDGGIQAAHLAAGSVTTEALRAGSVATQHLQAGAVDTPQLKAGSVTADIVQVRTLRGDNLEIGAITVLELSSEVGQELDISSNSAVNILVSNIDEVAAAQQDTQSTVEEMATYYRFGANGAEISSPNSPYSLRLANDRIEILQLGVAVSYWDSGRLIVPSFVGESVVLGNHQLVKNGANTVVRKL